MRKLLLLLVIVLLSSNIHSQPVNCNPDPNGPFWAGGGVEPYTLEEQDIIDNMNEMEQLSSANFATDFVRNDEKAYFPPIMYQVMVNLCAQASLVYYALTYEINYKLNSNASGATTFHPSFIYNFLNNGENNGSSLIYTMEALKEIGALSKQSYLQCASGISPIDNNVNSDITEWISGYNYYEEALSNRVTNVEKINIENKPIVLKSWLYNHNDDTQQDGGVAVIVFEHMEGVKTSAGFGNYSHTIFINNLSFSTPNVEDAHAMTIVGWDDNYDYGGSSTGAFRLANSWGALFGGTNDIGFCYLPYSLVDKEYLLLRDNNDDIWAFAIHAEANYHTDLILRQELLCNDRYYISHCVGGHYDYGSPIPFSSYKYEYSTYNPAGHNPLLGYDFTDIPMEYSLDYQYFVDTLDIDRDDIATFHYGILHNSFINPEPTSLYHLSLIDNRCQTPIEIVEVSSPTIIDMTNLNNGNYCWVDIDYKRLDETYSANEIIDGEIYAHCLSTIEPGVAIEFANNANVLFYDGEIVVEYGATLDLSSCNIRAKQGENKITVYGNLIIDENPTILCEGGSFEIEYKSGGIPPTHYYISGGNFYGANEFDMLRITGFSEALTIENCKLLNTQIEYAGNLTIQQLDANTSNLEVFSITGDLLVQNNELLTDTYISASMPDNNQKSVNISFNNFKNANEGQHKSIVSINDYRIFSIDENDIEINHCNGIELYHAGNNAGADKIVSNNIIYCNTPGNECRAIDVFFSRADIYKNEIYDNKYGVVAFGGSETTIMGSEAATSVSNTQQFIDNNIHCYFSYTSYPEDIRYNYFKHNSSITDPYVKLVYYDLIEDPPVVDGSVIYNITCNAWDSEFNGEQDLLPLGSYDYEPYWYPGQTCTTD